MNESPQATSRRCRSPQKMEPSALQNQYRNHNEIGDDVWSTEVLVCHVEPRAMDRKYARQRLPTLKIEKLFCKRLTATHEGSTYLSKISVEVGEIRGVLSDKHAKAFVEFGGSFAAPQYATSKGISAWQYYLEYLSVMDVDMAPSCFYVELGPGAQERTTCVAEVQWSDISLTMSGLASPDWLLTRIIHLDQVAARILTIEGGKHLASYNY